MDRNGDGLGESDILLEQIAYYRARAPEYDRWFHREGRYDRGEDASAKWARELKEVRAALTRVPFDGAEVIELAAGTGIWTDLLVGRARRVTAVDAAPEMLEENRRRLGVKADSVSFVLADLFSWRADRRFDAVVFCFWMSHVPNARLSEFLDTVALMLRPGGQVFFLDGRKEPTSTAADHHLPAAGEEQMVRRLDDGREFRIVKSFRDPRVLEERFLTAGLDVEVEETATYFQFGAGVRIHRAPR